jgi:type VI secretion system protein ImpA
MITPKKRFPGSLVNLYDKARLFVFDAPQPSKPPPPPPPPTPKPPSAPMQMLPMIPSSLPTPRLLISPEHQAELDLLLKPITEDQPCGPASRYDPLFTEIRLAREEDDPSLPMGQWERPLKRADWALIESRCKDMLIHRSKDLQIAAWLMEAWTRQHGFEGLYRGLSLIDCLLRQYWEPLHPVIEDAEDCDARVAPLEWLNESMSMTLRVQVPLLKLVGYKPSRVALADWERMTAKELTGQSHADDNSRAGDGTEAVPTREDACAYALKYLSQDIAIKIELVQGCIRCLSSLLSFVDAQLGMQSPNLSKIKGALATIERVLVQLLPERKGPQMTPDMQNSAQQSIQQNDDIPAASAQGEASPALALSGWKNRHEAYATLGAIADYLSLVEPHSPTPYLLRRAVNWGRMPLPELMAEIIREEGDLNRLMNVLGLKE